MDHGRDRGDPVVQSEEVGAWAEQLRVDASTDYSTVCSRSPHDDVLVTQGVGLPDDASHWTIGPLDEEGRSRTLIGRCSPIGVAEPRMRSRWTSGAGPMTVARLRGG
jgi:hypothetical protein